MFQSDVQKKPEVGPRGVQEQAQGFQETKRRFLQTGWFLWYKYFELFNIGLYAFFIKGKKKPEKCDRLVKTKSLFAQ